MAEDFLDAHNRHWTDAEKLYQANRWANADHLYGFAAECGLKSLIVVLNGSLAAGDRKHIMERTGTANAWERFEAYRSGHPLGARFPLPSSNPFAAWHASQRYENQLSFTQATADVHRAGAVFVKSLVGTAIMDGLL
jgi:hypothetical protein